MTRGMYGLGWVRTTCEGGTTHVACDGELGRHMKSWKLGHLVSLICKVTLSASLWITCVMLVSVGVHTHTRGVEAEPLLH